MRIIYKYDIKLAARQEIEMPQGAIFLAFQKQGEGDLVGSFKLWAEVDHTRPMVKEIFHIIGTGSPFPEHEDIGYLNYVGTVQSNSFVWHLYCERELPF